MFGYFRFFLASLVIYSHTTTAYFLGKIPFDFGKMAVFGFYILAGLVSAKLISNIFFYDKKKYLKDRFLRIYPMAIFWQIIGMIVLLYFFNQKIEINFLKLLYHIALIPLDYSGFLDVSILKNEPLWSNFVFAPYFSLGVELQAYMLFALFLCLNSKKILHILGTISFVLYCLSSLLNFQNTFFQMQLNYILLPSVFWLFYLGYLIYIKNNKILLIYYLLTIVLIILELLNNSFYGAQPFCSIAILFCIPIIYFLNLNNEKKRKFNNFFGSMSFIIYCNHYLFILILQENKIGYDFWAIFFMAFLSGLITYYLIEKPLDRFRKNKIKVSLKEIYKELIDRI